ncbi:MAG: hypothetical protein KAT43_01235 [Nanoarchaeota archaeon]|nr:hypothetical protein [Nanoarchaeota archaeon]
MNIDIKSFKIGSLRLRKISNKLKVLFVLLSYILLIIFSILLIVSKNFSPLGQSLLVGLILILFTYFFTKHVFEFEKRSRWEKIQKNATLNLCEEFSKILSDIEDLCSLTEASSFDHEVSDNRYWEKHSKIVLAKLKKAADARNININQHLKDSLLNDEFETFRKGEAYINRFQLKYWDYLEADVIINLINIQKACHSIDQQIKIRNIETQNRKNEARDKKILSGIEKQLQIIIKGIQVLICKGILKYR